MRLPQPTYSSVTATAALFVALGGTGYAVSAIPNNSVGRQQLKANAVTGPKVRQQSLTHKDIKNGSVIGKSLQAGTLSSREIGQGTLNGGDIGDGSLTGADIADGSIGLEKLTTLPAESANLPSAGEKAALAGSTGTPGAANPYVTSSDPRLSDHFTGAAAGGDLEGTYPNPTLRSSLNDAAAGTPSLRSLGTGATQAAAGNDPRLSDSRTPTGTAGGDLDGTFPAPTLRADSVTTGKVFDGTLTAPDFAPGLSDGPAANATLRSLGTGATQAAAGNDPRLSNARTPTAGSVVPASFGNIPARNARQTVPQSLPPNAFNTVQLDDPGFGAGVSFDDANDRLVVNTPGIYLVQGYVGFAANATGTRGVSVLASGGEVAAQINKAADAGDSAVEASGVAVLGSGSMVFLTAAQTSGANLSTVSFSGRSASLSLTWLGPVPSGARPARATEEAARKTLR